MRMRVEFAEAPPAIGTRKPRFFWEVPLEGRGRRQGAYQVLVATAPALLEPGKADLWDSGKVASAQSSNVKYAGTELQSNTDCYWKVGLWDEAGRALGFGPVGTFGTALFDAADWTAKWIGMGDPDEPLVDPAIFKEKLPPEVAAIEPEMRAPMLRAEFDIDRPVRRARAFVCGLGICELRLNGTKVGDEVLVPPRTEYRERVLFSTLDVAAQLVPGRNAVGLLLGNGWFNGQKSYWGWQTQWYGSPRAIVQLELEFEDGSRQRVVSDGSWRGAWSPIVFNGIYDGEDYDARLEQPGWDAAGFDDTEWRNANVVPSPGGRLEPLSCEPDRVIEIVRPVAVNEPAPGVFVYDLGRNMTGWVRLCVRGGEAGDAVRLRFGEAADERGALDARTNNRARQADNYILRGDGEETWEPRFTYHGFRYVELTGYPGTPDLDTIEGRFVHMAVEQTGSFECANELINRIHQCTLQSQRCNLQMGVPTDDTQRPERLGWGADAWAVAPEAFYNLGVARLFDKWIADFRDQQGDLGAVGMIAPQAGSEEDLVWSACFLLVPWWQYLHCGDRRILEENYPAFQRYLAYLRRVGVKEVATQPPDGVIDSLLWRSGVEKRFPAEADRGHLQLSQWGDHLATAEGSASRANLPLSIATAFYYLDVRLLAKIAAVLGKDEDAPAYAALAGEIADAFNARFLDRNVGYYDTGVQAAQAWPLAFGLVPDEERQRVARYFCDSVDRRQGHLTTGYAGTRFAVEVLDQCGRNDLLWRLATATDYPSWGYMLRNPERTTIAENWAGGGSLCHTALGAAIDEWFYWGLAGIRPDETAPGYARIVFKPYLPPNLPWARASLRTPRGEIASAWRREDGVATWEVTVPANSTATVYVPAADPAQVTEGDGPASEAEAVTFLRAEDGVSVFEAGSGVYRFRFPA